MPTAGGEVMPCPICDEKPINCDCTEMERRQFSGIEDLKAEIERLLAEVAVLKDSAEKLYDIAASGAEPIQRRRMLDQMAMESFAEDG